MAVVAVAAHQITFGLHLGVEQVLDLVERGGVSVVWVARARAQS